MHRTQAFLVRVATDGLIFAEKVKGEAIEELNRHEDVYDYYMLLQNEKYFPAGVLFGKQYPKKLIDVIDACKREQYANAAAHRKALELDTDAGLKRVMSFLKNGMDNLDVGMKTSGVDVEKLEKYIALISGEYCDESVFYDTEAASAFIDIEKIKANPAEWALVMFDLHV